MIPVSHVLILSAVLFAIGVGGVIVRRNAIVIFMSVELMLNAVNLAFVGFAYGMQSMVGAPTAASMTGPGMGSSVGYDWLGTPAAMERGVGEPPLPDDGDPTREDRSFAVTQAMEEIERSQGVTIIDIEPETQEALAREVAATTRVEETEDEADTNADETEDEDEIEEAGAADTADDADAPPEESAEPTDPLELPDRRQDADGGNDGPAGGHSGSYDWRGRPIG